MPALSLTLLEHTLSICRLKPEASIPEVVLNNPFFAAVRTDEELSLVIPEPVEINCEKTEGGWACFKVIGPLNLSQVRILAKLAAALADAQVAIFALSTFDTDYILVKWEQVRVAQEALTSAGYKVQQGRK